MGEERQCAGERGSGRRIGARGETALHNEEPQEVRFTHDVSSYASNHPYTSDYSLSLSTVVVL